MPDDLRAHVLALATALPTGAAVPVPREWLLTLLEPAPASSVSTPEPADEPLLTADDVAARFGLSKDWCYRHWRAIGGVKLSRKVPRFPATAVRRYLASRSKKPS